jgi:Zn-dependent protease with chaperone function
MLPFEAVEVDANVNTSSDAPLWRQLLTLALGLFSSLGVLWLALQLLVWGLIHFIPVPLEAALAKLQPLLLEKMQVDSAPPKRLASVLNRLMASNSQYWRGKVRPVVLLSKEATLNAMALPGGVIVLHQGMLTVLPTDDELAYVLGHELGHFIHHDHLQAFVSQLMLSALLGMAVGDTQGAGAGLLQRLMFLVSLGHSRTQESAADREALSLMQRAGFKGEGALKVLQTFKREEEKEGGRLSSFLSTHPSSEERYNAMAQNLKVSATL